MVNLFQIKFIKQVIMLLTVALLLPYQQVSNAGAAIRGGQADIDGYIESFEHLIVDNLDGSADLFRDSEGILVIDLPDADDPSTRVAAVIDFKAALGGGYLEEYTSTIAALNTINSSAVIDTTAQTQLLALREIDAMSLLVTAIDGMIGVADDLRRIYARGNIGEIPPYGGGLDNESVIGFSNTMHNIFEAIFADLLNEINTQAGGGVLNPSIMFPQTPDCNGLFCSLYTLRDENPDESIDSFIYTELAVRDTISSEGNFITSGVFEAMRSGMFADLIRRQSSSGLNILRQSRAATEIALPGNDPNAGYVAPVAPVAPVDPCIEAPSLCP